MAGRLKTIDNWLLTRRCVRCGYDGSLLRAGQAQRCARCGCDLRARPARSYAEMEGLVGHQLAGQTTLCSRHSRLEERLISRWLAFFFMALICLVAIACLAAAAVSGV